MGVFRVCGGEISVEARAFEGTALSELSQCCGGGVYLVARYGGEMACV